MAELDKPYKPKHAEIIKGAAAQSVEQEQMSHFHAENLKNFGLKQKELDALKGIVDFTKLDDSDGNTTRGYKFEYNGHEVRAYEFSRGGDCTIMFDNETLPDKHLAEALLNKLDAYSGFLAHEMDYDYEGVAKIKIKSSPKLSERQRKEALQVSRAKEKEREEKDKRAQEKLGLGNKLAIVKSFLGE